MTLASNAFMHLILAGEAHANTYLGFLLARHRNCLRFKLGLINVAINKTRPVSGGAWSDCCRRSEEARQGKNPRLHLPNETAASGSTGSRGNKHRHNGPDLPGHGQEARSFIIGPMNY